MGATSRSCLGGTGRPTPTGARSLAGIASMNSDLRDGRDLALLGAVAPARIHQEFLETSSSAGRSVEVGDSPRELWRL